MNAHYPAALREALEPMKAQQVRFALAWSRATAACAAHPDSRDWPDVRAIFEREYDGRGGGCTIPSRDVCMLHEVSMTPVPPPSVVYCRSGDGCDRKVPGGGKFCGHHQRELDRIRESMGPMVWGKVA